VKVRGCIRVKRYKNKSQKWLYESFPVTDNNETIYGKEIAFIKVKSVNRVDGKGIRMSGRTLMNP